MNVSSIDFNWLILILLLKKTPALFIHFYLEKHGPLFESCQLICKQFCIIFFNEQVLIAYISLPSIDGNIDASYM